MTDLAARHAAIAADVEGRVAAVLRSGTWVGGPVVAEVEQAAAALFGRAGAAGTASGTDALALALLAVGVRPGDEVIVPALSFFATAGAARSIGASVVVVDVREDGCLDPDAARRAITLRTRAIVPVHLYGTRAQGPDTDIAVVDDAAQAAGADPPRSTGALSAVSTYPTKTWGCAGDGGFVVGDDPALLDRVRRLGHHGFDGAAFHTVDGVVGRNSRLDAVQAAVLLAHLPHLPARVARRRAIALRYDANLPPEVRPLPRDRGHPVHQYAALFPDRDRARDVLAARGVQTRIYYPRPLHREPALALTAATPVADHLCRHLLCLPVHEGLTDDDVRVVLEAVEAAT